MNPDFLTNGGTDFRFDAFDEAHANTAEFIGRSDRGGDFQRRLFYLAPAQVRSRVDAFERARRFNCFHNLFPGCVVDSFNDPTILSDAFLLDREFGDRHPANIERNHRHRRCLTQNYPDFMQGNSADFQI